MSRLYPVQVRRKHPVAVIQMNAPTVESSIQNLSSIHLGLAVHPVSQKCSKPKPKVGDCIHAVVIIPGSCSVIHKHGWSNSTELSGHNSRVCPTCSIQMWFSLESLSHCKVKKKEVVETFFAHLFRFFLLS